MAMLRKTALIREFGRANLVNTVGFAKNHDRGYIRPNNINKIIAIWTNRTNRQIFISYLCQLLGQTVLITLVISGSIGE